MADETTRRVLHVLAELCPSGAESMLLSARPVFLEYGYEGDILGTGASVGSFARALDTAGYRIHHIPFAKSPRFFYRVYQLMRGGRYDVIHLHTERASFWFGLVALAARPARVVRAVHNVFPYRGSLRRRRKLQRRVLSRLGVIHVAGGTDVQRTELAHHGVRAVLVPNWYDTRRIFPPLEGERRRAREALDIDVADTVVVTIGNCSTTKNHAALIRAIAQLPTELRPLYLHVGAEELDEPERELATRLGISALIRFLGAVDDLRPVYCASDIYVMPSLNEGRSVAALEGLATGLPAILSDVAGLRDLSDLYPGLCYAEPTVDSLATALATMLAENPEERRSRSAEYPEISRTHFGVEASVAEYVRIYQGER